MGTKARDKIKDKKMLGKRTRETEIKTEEGKKFLKQKYEGHSRDVVKGHLKHYIVFRDKNCKQLIDKVDEDWDEPRRERDFVAEHHLTKFERWLRDELNYAEKTVNNHIISIRSFYKFNNYPINGDRLNLKSDNPSTKPKNQARAIGKKTVKKLYNSTSSKRNRAILLFLYQTGQGSNELSVLDYGDVKPELGKEKYPLKISYPDRKNSGLGYCTFLGADGIETLKEYLEEREEKLGRELQADDPLFAKRDGESRLSSNAISEILKYITKKAPDNLITEEELEKADINPFRPHAFRKNFKTRLVEGAINNRVIEYMMGHKLDKVERSYWIIERMGGEENLREIYAEKIEPELSIDVESTIAEVSTSSDLKDNWKELVKEKLGEDLVFKEDHEEDVEKFKSKWLDSQEERDKLRKDLEEQSEVITEYEKEIENLEENIENQDGKLEEQSEVVTLLAEEVKEGIEPEILSNLLDIAEEIESSDHPLFTDMENEELEEEGIRLIETKNVLMDLFEKRKEEEKEITNTGFRKRMVALNRFESWINEFLAKEKEFDKELGQFENEHEQLENIKAVFEDKGWDYFVWPRLSKNFNLREIKQFDIDLDLILNALRNPHHPIDNPFVGYLEELEN